MWFDGTHGTLVIRFGERFAAEEVERASEAILVTSPLSQLTLDFGDVQHLDLTAIIPLAEALKRLQGVSVLFRGLTLHQSRMFKYLGIAATALPGG
jgi:anti-anti-sigma regulatory factor